MSESQPRHAAPNPKANIKALRTLRFWAFPILATLALMSALAGLYLGGILNPITNLRHFPIAVVNEDAGPWGAKLVEGLVGQALCRVGADRARCRHHGEQRQHQPDQQDAAKPPGAPRAAH